MRALKHKLLIALKRTAIVAPIVLTFLGTGMMVAQPVYAAPKVTTKCANAATGNSIAIGDYKKTCGCNSGDLTTENCGIVYYLWLVINFLSALVGIVVVISI